MVLKLRLLKLTRRRRFNKIQSLKFKNSKFKFKHRILLNDIINEKTISSNKSRLPAYLKRSLIFFCLVLFLLQSYLTLNLENLMFIDFLSKSMTTENDLPELIQKLVSNLLNYDVW